MITREVRETLQILEGLPEGGIGWDCDCRVIKAGDMVEVVRGEEIREGDPEYEYCSVGKQGKAIWTPGAISWTVIVKFSDGQIAGCSDLNLRKI